MKNKSIYFILIAFVLSFLLYYSLSSVNEEPEISFSKSTIVTKGIVQKKIILVGQITASKIMGVNSSITGKIIEKKYSLGDSIKAGETLLTIKPDQEKYVEYLQNKNNFFQAEIDFKEKEIEYNHNKELFESHFITEDELRKSKNDFEITKMKFQISKNTFEIYKSKYNIDENSIFKIIPITAPISGIITEDNVEEGNYVKSALSEYNEGTVICVIGNFDKLKADFSIAEEYLPILRKTATVNIKNKKGLSLGIGEIMRISPIGNSDDGYVSFDFSVVFNAPKSRIAPGASVKAELIVDEKKDCLRAQMQAINFDGEQAFVNLKDGETSKRKDVTLGVVGNRFVEIKNGLSEGDSLTYWV